MVVEFRIKIRSNEFTTAIIFQPLPLLYSEKSVEASTNVVGHAGCHHDALVIQILDRVETAELARWE